MSQHLLDKEVTTAKKEEYTSHHESYRTGMEKSLPHKMASGYKLSASFHEEDKENLDEE